MISKSELNFTEGLNMLELTVEAKIENIPKVTEFVDKILEEYDCPIKEQTQIDVALDEVLSNVANYAYEKKDGSVSINVDVSDDPRQVTITFTDSGTPYDPLKKEDPDITLGADERPIGGLGIFIVKKTMDDVIYEYKDGQNVLQIKKNI